MRISAKPSVSDESKRQIREWALGLLKGASVNVPAFLSNGGTLWIDEAPKAIRGNGYFYRDSSIVFLGNQLGRAESNVSLVDEIAIVAAMCSYCEVEFDEELEGALTEALAKAFAKIWQALEETQIIQASGTPTQLAWNSGQIAAMIDGEWVYGRTGQLAPVDDTWTQVSL